MISGRATRLVLSPAFIGGRAIGDSATLRTEMASPPIRDEIAAQLWARGYPNVRLSRSNIESRATAPQPRRQS
jgi:hypothetical protein